EIAINEGGASAPTSSAASASVVPLPPSNTSPPTITGSPRQGQTLTEHPGSWTNSPTSFSYQRLQCDCSGNACAPISGATAQTYVPGAGNVGHTIRVQEEAANGFGSGNPASSEATAPVLPAPPSSTSLPTITGTAQQGQ